MPSAHCAQAWVCACKDIRVVCTQGTMTHARDFSHLTPPWPLKVCFPVGCPDTIDCKKKQFRCEKSCDTDPLSGKVEQFHAI